MIAMSSNIRKSMVLNSRSMAEGPQILALIWDSLAVLPAFGTIVSPEGSRETRLPFVRL
jgi:hypothetical protein